VTDEYIRAFQILWAEPRPSFKGRYVRCEGLIFEPKPLQKPHPPIWVGGESGPALRRAARLGDGWYPIGTNLDSLPRLKAGVARLRSPTDKAGRDPSGVAVVYRVKRIGAGLPARASDGERRLFSGGDAEIVDDLRAMQEAGVGGIDFDIERPAPEAAIDELRRIHSSIIGPATA
jgi:alkanesulfonate monooxygenase SsuD/methylene tetrahydromethanopterin reductase-like flavin-dependent oxidoreductase (luciferase family)